MNKTLKNIIRKHQLKKITGNLGKIVETQDKIICYVKENKCRQTKHTMIINCSVPRLDGKKKYGIDKKIVYVIENLDIKDKSLYINGYAGCEIIIRECNLNFDIDIYTDGTCTIENTSITSVEPFASIAVKNLILKNTSINASTLYIETAQNLELVHSRIGNSLSDIDILSLDNLNMKNTSIYGKNIRCISINVTSDDQSILSAQNKAEIGSSNFNKINVKAKTIIANQKQLPPTSSKVVLEMPGQKLKNARIELINQLKRIKRKINTQNQCLIKKYQTTLESKPISRVLSK